MTLVNYSERTTETSKIKFMMNENNTTGTEPC